MLVPFSASRREMSDDTAREALFPYCQRCVEHAEHWDAGSMTSAAVTLVGIMAGVLVGWSAGVLAGVLLFLLLAVVAHLIGARIHARSASRCGPSCVSVAPELRRLLEANVEARRRAPTPAIAAAIPPSPSDPAAWLAHIDRQPTRVLRRLAVARALASLSSATDREVVIENACLWELTPILERLERTPPRRLRAGIEELAERVNADNLPPALVGAMLAALERRLVEAGSGNHRVATRR